MSMQGDMAFSYRGESMRGTFRRGDVLLVAPAGLAEIRVGDVVALRRARPDGTFALIAHRVRARSAAGLVTCGDRALAFTETVTAEELVGRVHHFQRGGKTRRVWGGCWGILRVAALRLGWRLRRLFRRPYRWLRAGGLVRRLWKPRLEQVLLTTAEGPLIKYIHRGRTVAWWWPEEGRFWVRKPYDLVIGRPGTFPQPPLYTRQARQARSRPNSA